MIMDGEVRANGKLFTITSNCFWITIYDEDNNVVFKREPEQDDWYDKDHQTICNCLEVLERIFGIVYDDE